MKNHTNVAQILKDCYMKQTKKQLNKMKNEATDSKLHLFSHVLDLNSIPNYLQHSKLLATHRQIVHDGINPG